MADIDVWKTTASDDHNNVNIQRFVAPPSGLDDDMASLWQKLAQRRYPYNAVARYEDDLMKINAVVAPAAAGTSPTVLYTAFYGNEGTHPQADMKSKLDLLMNLVGELVLGKAGLTSSIAGLASLGRELESERRLARRGADRFQALQDDGERTGIADESRQQSCRYRGPDARLVFLLHRRDGGIPRTRGHVLVSPVIFFALNFSLAPLGRGLG